uniref:Zf-RVT domain-containing protein n=1 Tax=Strongyloides venezuelensis TaxID=75913 RepID=A0A0K0FT49_STRVS
MNTEITHVNNPESKCIHCLEPDTRKHILNGCQSRIMGNLYTKRHNMVVNVIIKNILNKQKIPNKHQLRKKQTKQYKDLQIYYDRPIASKVASNKPDVIIITKKESTIIKIAVSGYTIMATKRLEKLGKYKPLENDLTTTHKKQFKTYAIVIDSNGELQIDCLKEWIKMTKHLKMGKKLSKNILNTIKQKVNRFSDYILKTYLSIKQQTKKEKNRDEK